MYRYRAICNPGTKPIESTQMPLYQSREEVQKELDGEPQPRLAGYGPTPSLISTLEPTDGTNVPNSQAEMEKICTMRRCRVPMPTFTAPEDDPRPPAHGDIGIGQQAYNPMCFKANSCQKDADCKLSNCCTYENGMGDMDVDSCSNLGNLKCGTNGTCTGKQR